MTHHDKEIYDCIIVGGGSAGYAAGIYCARARMKSVLFEGLLPGGEAAKTDIIENYPGFPEPINGPELMLRFRKQAENFGLEFRYNMVEKARSEGDLRIVTLDDQSELKAYSLIIATGATHMHLNVPGEKEYAARGVSYCATCDGPFFKNAPVAVVGGGDSAVEEGTYLTRFASKVFIIHRRNQLRATKIIQERAEANPKVEFILETVVDEVKGNERGVTGLVLKNVKTGAKRDLPLEGVFVFIGMNPNTGFLTGFLKMTENGNIITDEYMRTSLPGVYAAGDNRTNSYRQVATAVGDAVTASIDAEKYVESVKHRK
jgi:thioredoxin reductase (NADPH)